MNTLKTRRLRARIVYAFIVWRARLREVSGVDPKILEASSVFARGLLKMLTIGHARKQTSRPASRTTFLI
jgi:hypothetical protein